MTGVRLGYRPELDGVRAVAITLVVITHAAPPRALGGALGVTIFFVLSGFLITRLLMQEVEATGRLDLRRFYIRRALRLYPALLVMVAILGSAGIVGALTSITYTTNLVIQATGQYLMPFSHTWSLAQEEQFYLLWPLAFLFIRGRHAVHLLLGLATASMLYAVATYHGFDVPWFSPLARCHPMLLGCALALTRWRAPRGSRWVGVLLIGLGVVASSHWRQSFALVEIITAAATVLVLADMGGVLQRVLAWGPAVWLGRRSYAVYLWHFPLIVLLGKHYGQGITAAIAVPSALILAAVSWELVEKPFLRLRRSVVRGPVRRVGLDAHQVSS